MKLFHIMVALLLFAGLVGGGCTKTETVEKVVEKPVEVIVEVPVVQEPGTTVNEQPAEVPTVIATGTDVEIDTTGNITSGTQPKPEPPVVEPVSQETSAPTVSPTLNMAQYLTGQYTAAGNRDAKGTEFWAKDVGITDLAAVTNLAAYPSTPAGSGRVYGLAIDADGRKLYFTDVTSNSVRQLNLTNGQVTTIAGGGQVYKYGTMDSVGQQARFNQALGIALSPDKKYLYVADTNNHTIRRLTLDTAVVQLYAGTPLVYAFTDGPRLPAVTGQSSVQFKTPQGVVAAEDGTVYVADTGNGAIRAIAPDAGGQFGAVTTLSKSTDLAKDPFYPNQMVLDGSTLYVAGTGGGVIWKIDIPTKTRTVLAGAPGVSGLVATDPTVSPSCPATPDSTRTDCIYGTQARFRKPLGVSKFGNKLYVTDGTIYANAVLEIDLDKSALVTRIVGVPEGTLGVADGAFKDTRLTAPSHLAYDPATNSLYVAEDNNSMMRRLDLTAQQSFKSVGFYLLYGNVKNADADVVAPLDTRFSAAWYLTLLDDNKILVSDQAACRIRLVTLDPKFGEIVTDANGKRSNNTANTTSTWAGKSPCDSNAMAAKMPVSPHPETDESGPGEFYRPLPITINDDKTEVYVAGLKIIQKVSVADPKDIKVVAGTLLSVTSTDGVGKSATFSDHRDMKFVAELQPDGTTKPALYILDADSIRRISLAPEDYATVTTVVGSNSRVGHVDGVGQEAALMGANRMAYVKRGTKQYLYVTESGSGYGVSAKGGNNDIREVLLIDNGEKKYVVKTVAGSGMDETRDGNGLKASFDWPRAIAAVVTPDGNAVLYVHELKGGFIRKVDLQTLDVTTVSGNGFQGFMDGVGDNASWRGATDMVYSAKHNRIFLMELDAIRILGPEWGQVLTFHF